MKLLPFLSSALLICPPAFAATLAVLPGESIQAKVDAAAPGDIVAIFGGTYSADVNITKAIRLVEVDGQDVTITGNVTWSGVTNAPPFVGFTVGSSGKGITVTNTTGLTIKGVDARGGVGIKVIGTSNVGILNCLTSRIDQDGGELYASSTQVSSAFDTTINSQKTIVFRTTIASSSTWNTKNAWLGYSSFGLFAFAGTSRKVVIVGCSFSAASNTTSDIVVLGGTANTYTIINSIAKDAVYGSWDYVGQVGGSCLRLNSGNSAFVANNYLQCKNTSVVPPGYTGAYGCGIYSETSNLVAVNNICHGCYRAITAPYGAIAKNTFAYQVTNLATGGVLPIDTQQGDPLFVSGNAPQLQAASPCINAGVNDPIFNDLVSCNIHNFG